MNTLGGNSENFIRPQTLRPVCTLYSPRSESGRASAMHRNDQSDDHRDDDAECVKVDFWLFLKLINTETSAFLRVL